jgi:hypothetical protein
VGKRLKKNECIGRGWEQEEEQQQQQPVSFLFILVFTVNCMIATKAPTTTI